MTVQEYFNIWNNKTIEEIEARAAAIKAIIDSDPSADMEAINCELEGLRQAKDNKAEKAQQRSVFNPITGTKVMQKPFAGDVYESPEYRSAFFKSLLGQELTAQETAAMNLAKVDKRESTFNTTGNSAAIIPTQTLNEIISKARTMGGLLPECRQFAMPSNIKIPVGTPSAKAAWHTEGAAVESQSVTTTAVTFAAYEIMKVFSMSVNAKTMGVSAFENYLTQELTNCVMETIADAIVNGTGSSQGTGLESGITWATSGTGKNAVQIAANGSFTYAKVVETVALLKRGYSQGAKWAMNNATLYNVFYGMLDGNDRPIFIADPKNEGIGKILGYDVVIDDNIADNTAYFGNFKYMGYNLAQGIAVEASRESSFRSGLIDYRAMAIADCKPIVAEAFVKLCKASA